jgi:hypothetical protein
MRSDAKRQPICSLRDPDARSDPNPVSVTCSLATTPLAAVCVAAFSTLVERHGGAAHPPPPNCTTYSSWLNQVGLWFAKIQRDVIARGVFRSVAAGNKLRSDTSARTPNQPSRSDGPTPILPAGSS